MLLKYTLMVIFTFSFLLVTVYVTVSFVYISRQGSKAFREMTNLFKKSDRNAPDYRKGLGIKWYKDCDDLLASERSNQIYRDALDLSHQFVFTLRTVLFFSVAVIIFLFFLND
jgi:predicted PurR-regulated permease PerM